MSIDGKLKELFQNRLAIKSEDLIKIYLEGFKTLDDFIKYGEMFIQLEIKKEDKKNL